MLEGPADIDVELDWQAGQPLGQEIAFGPSALAHTIDPHFGDQFPIDVPFDRNLHPSEIQAAQCGKGEIAHCREVFVGQLANIGEIAAGRA